MNDGMDLAGDFIQEGRGMEAHTDRVRVAFGPFMLDLGDEALHQDARPVALRPKTFAVLRLLVAHPQRLVTKQQLLETVWRGTFVSDTVLKVCVRELRAALGDSSAAPRYIQTVHGRGYRFIAPLHEHPP